MYVLLAIGAAVLTGLYVVQLIEQNYSESRFGPRFSVSLEQPAASTDAGSIPIGAERHTLRIAIAPVISPEKSIETYDDLATYVAAQLEREVEILPRATYAETNELVRDRQCDIALVCTYPFVRGEKDFGMEVLAVPQVGGELTYHSMIVVPASSEADSLLDLRGRRFACADMMSNSGWLFPALWLLERNEEPESFFSDVLISGSHDRSVQAVLSDYADGAAVHSLVYARMVEDDPTILTRTKVIQESVSYGMPPFVVHPQLSEELKSRLREILLRMHEEPEGRPVLSAIGIDRFVVPDLAIYESVRNSAHLWESR
jgi:phosphonate transport system substrate-binding protein